MKILVTGCGGMVGAAIYSELKDFHKIYPTSSRASEDWLRPLDVRSHHNVEECVHVEQPDVIIHLAALTDLEYCEKNSLHAYDVNFMGTYNVMKAARKRDIPFVYISTAGIFDGVTGDYKEDDAPNPLNVYAKSKFAGELAALSYSKSIVVRSGWMIGGGPVKDKSFTNKIIKQIRDGQQQLYVVNDMEGSITYTYDLTNTIHHLILNKAYGLFHTVCYNNGTRLEIAREILKIFKLQNKVRIVPVDSNFFKTEYFAVRPKHETLINTKLCSAVKWQDCLKDYLMRFDWGYND
jgi:dTDP-4-dehydrorhamnose reductase